MKRQTNKTWTKMSAIFMFVLMLQLPFINALSISQVNIVQTPTGATFSFATDQPANTSIQATHDEQIHQSADPLFKSFHHLTLTGLTPSSQYTYTIQASDNQGGTAQHQGTFNTLSEDAIYFHLDAPTLSNGAPFDIHITTVPFTHVLYYLNNQILGSYTANSEGKLTLSNVQLPINAQEHTLRFAYTIDDQQYDHTHTVEMDTEMPVLTFAEVPEVIGTGSLTITGNSSKPVSMSLDVFNYETNTAKHEGTKEIDEQFQFSMPLQDGENRLTFRAKDAAGNIAERIFVVVVDALPVEILSHNLADIDPSSTKEVTVRGQVNKPGIRIIITVGRQGSDIGGVEECIYGQVDEIGGVSCENLMINQGLQKFETNADAEGYFSQRVLLHSMFDADHLTFNFDEYVTIDGEVPQFRDPNTTGASGEYDSTSSRNVVTIIARDAAGKTDKQSAHVTYQTCPVAGHWAINMGEVHPAKILPDHVFAGIASLSFSLNIDYFGPSSEWPQINSISMRRQQLSIQDGANKAPESMLRPETCVFQPSSGVIGGTYVYCNLEKWPASTVDATERYKILEDMEFLNFPIEFHIDYAEVDPWTGQVVSQHQRVCSDIKVFVDRRLPPDKIPEGLLNTSVEVLDTTIDAIDQILKPLGTINLATTGVCLGTYVYSFFSNVGEVLACNNPAIKMRPEEAQFIERVLRGAEKGKDPIQAVEEMLNGEAGAQMTNMRDGEASWESCAQKIDSRLQAERFQNMVCDRIFCPAVPSGQHYVQQIAHDSKTSACGPMSPYPNTKNPGQKVNGEYTFNSLEGCGKEYHDEWNAACLGLDVVAESNRLADPNPEPDPGYSLQSFLNVFDNFCPVQDENDDRRFFSRGNNVYKYDSENNAWQLGDMTEHGNLLANDEIDRDRLRQSIATKDIDGASSTYVQSVDGRLVVLPVHENQPMQFRQNHEHTTAYNISGKNVAATKYGDTLVTEDGRMFNYSGGNFNNPIPHQHVCRRTLDSGDIQYYTDDCQASNAIRGPDELKQKVGPPIVVDPTSSFLRSLQCVCLPAIEGYLAQIRNILHAIRTCFEGILISGEFNAGMCKAILTQYLCDWIFEAIKCAIRAVGGSDPNATLSANVADGSNDVRRGFAAMSSAGNSVRQRAMERYGNTATFNALFTQRQLIHAVCLAAFGYDWVPDIQAAISVRGGGFEIDSQGGIAVATRRFMGADPYNQGLARHIYHVGYFLFAGSDLNWRLELVCSNDWSCDHPDAPDGRCDCSYGNAGQEQTIPFQGGQDVNPQQIPGQPPISPGGYQPGGTSHNPYQPFTAGNTYSLGGGSLRAQESIDSSRTEIYRSVVHDVRFDKVRLTWWSVNPQAQDAGRYGVIEKQIRSIGEAPASACTFQPQLLKFTCGFTASNQFGDVYFHGNNPLRTDQEIYAPGSKVRLVMDVIVHHRDTHPDAQVPKYAKIQFFRADQSTPQSPAYHYYEELNKAPPQVLPTAGWTLPIAAAIPMGQTTVSNLQFRGGTTFFNSSHALNHEAISGPIHNVPQYAYVLWKEDQNLDDACMFLYTDVGNINQASEFLNEYNIAKQSSEANVDLTPWQETTGLCEYADNVISNVKMTDRFQEGGNNVTQVSNINIPLQGPVNYIPHNGINKAMIRVTFNQQESHCVDGKMKFYAKVSLHESVINDLDFLPTYANPTSPSQFTFIYNGEEQVKWVTIHVSCTNNQQTENGVGTQSP